MAIFRRSTEEKAASRNILSSFIAQNYLNSADFHDLVCAAKSEAQVACADQPLINGSLKTLRDWSAELFEPFKHIWCVVQS